MSSNDRSGQLHAMQDAHTPFRSLHHPTRVAGTLFWLLEDRDPGPIASPTCAFSAGDMTWDPSGGRVSRKLFSMASSARSSSGASREFSWRLAVKHRLRCRHREVHGVVHWHGGHGYCQ